MQKLFSAFPDGWPGLGLVILRLTVGLSCIVHAFCAITAFSGVGLSAKAIGLSSIILGLILLIGFLTPVAGLVAAFIFLKNGAALFFANDLNKHANALIALDLVGVSLALFLLGPGAYSLDARLFGRREIIIPDSRRRPH